VTGPGAMARNAIGIVLVGGMAIGTLFTLFVVPSVYVLLAKDHRAHTSGSASPAAHPGYLEPDATAAE
jgi:multidrug efflux pump